MKKLLLPLVLLALLSVSCIKDNFDNCGATIDFEFSWNMQKTNTFASQVDEFVLFVFNEQGEFVKKIYAKGGYIKESDYHISLNDLPKGGYQFVVWAQSNTFQNETSFFDWSNFQNYTPNLADMKVFLRINQANRTFSSDLNNLLVGYYPTTYITSKSRRITIPTKKINNNIRVVLLDADKKGFASEDFMVRLEDATGHNIINHAYQVLPSEGFTYKPFYYKQITPSAEDLGGSVGSGSSVPQALAAEFAVSKLEVGQDISLVVYAKSGEKVFSKNLIDLLYLLKEEGHIPRNMEFQEFLDRQDQFSITVSVSVDTSNWLDTFLVINGWYINLLDIDF